MKRLKSMQFLICMPLAAPRSATAGFLVLILFAASATGADAGIITGSLSETIVEGRSGGQNFAWYLEDGGGFPNAWQNSTRESTAPGVTPGIGSRFSSNASIGGVNAWFQVTPTLPTAAAVYDVYATLSPSFGTISATSAIMLAGGSGLPDSTTAFSTGRSGDKWGFVGRLLLEPGVATPMIQFQETSHNLRFYADAILFAEMPPDLAPPGIYQWEYVNPADPSQGKRRSATYCPAGADANALPGANLAGLDLTMAYLNGANLSGVNISSANLTNAELAQANLLNANFSSSTLTAANLIGAEVRGANFGRGVNASGEFSGTGLTPAQLYSTASYLAHDLTGIKLQYNELIAADLAAQNLTGSELPNATLINANLRQANLSNGNFVSANLMGADLSQAILRNTDFRGANFTGATLTGVDVRGARVGGASGGSFVCISFGASCYIWRWVETNTIGSVSLAQLYTTASYQAHDLSGIDLFNTNLAVANFADQDLTNAVFDRATLTDADFTGAKLTNANFERAILTGASFSGSDVRGARFGTGYGGTGINSEQLSSTASHQAGNLTGIDLSFHNLAGWDFAGQNLTTATLSSADLRGADLSRTNLTNANLIGAKLTGTNFAGAEIRGANLAPGGYGSGITVAQLTSTASYLAHDLSGTNLGRINLTGIDLSAQNLSNARFDTADLSNANLSQANLSNANFFGANLSGANFDGAEVRGANLIRDTNAGIGGISLAQLYSTASS